MIYPLGDYEIKTRRHRGIISTEFFDGKLFYKKEQIAELSYSNKEVYILKWAHKEIENHRKVVKELENLTETNVRICRA